MNGLTALVLMQARRDRIVMPVWILGIGLLGFAVARAVSTEFGGEAERAAIIGMSAASPTFRFVRGLPDGTSIGSVVFFQGFTFTGVLSGLMSTFLVIRHTRTDEELGRSELIASAPLPRATPLAATMVLGGTANLLLGLCTAVGFAAAGLPVAGAVMTGAAVGSVGAFFVVVAACVAQVMPSGRAANGLAAGLVGAAYFVRGIGDAFGTTVTDPTHVSSAWVSLLSPIGWGQRSRPFTAADPVPLLLLTAAGAGVAVVVLVLRSRRDLGASLLPERLGRERARAGTTSFLGLAWRQQQPTLIGWSVAAGLLGSIAGSLAPAVSDVIGGNDSLADLIDRLVPGSRAGMVDLFTTALLGISGVLAAAAGIQAILRLRAEEAEGRAELLLAVPQSSTRWLAANLILASMSALVVALVAGISASAGLALSGTGSNLPGLVVRAALAHVPAGGRLHRGDGCPVRGDSAGQHSVGVGASCSRPGFGPVWRTPSPARVAAGLEPLPSFIGDAGRRLRSPGGRDARGGCHWRGSNRRSAAPAPGPQQLTDIG